MSIKKICFIDEIKDVYNDSVDVGVVFEDDYAYTILVSLPRDLIEEMEQEKTNKRNCYGNDTSLRGK